MLKKMMIIGGIVGVVTMGALFGVGCTGADRAHYSSLNSPCRITLYSGGKSVGVWESTGKVRTESGTDGWYFQDKTNGVLIRLSGTIVIEQL